MDKHNGQIVEYIVRKNGYSISDLARDIHVNRRSIYNWFNQKHLKTDIIFQIGCILRHDFSQEFPEIFVSGDFLSQQTAKKNEVVIPDNNAVENELYKNKYLLLLESYNEMLLRNRD